MTLTSIRYFKLAKRQLKEISPELEEPDLSRLAAQLASNQSLTDSIDKLTERLDEPLTLTFMWDRADGELTGSFKVKLTDEL